MAEFQYTMKQWRRMCKARESCGSCLLYGRCVDPDSQTDTEIATLEERIMQWVAEYPEPVYQTWGEYLFSTIYRQSLSFAQIMTEPIPAEIAQKLGIEPKEG